MITKEEYELNEYTYEDLEKLIGVLREVARAANAVDLEYVTHMKLWVMNGGEDEAEALIAALDAVPAWVLED